MSRSVMVLSHGHHLLPFAYRLVREDYDVKVAVVHAKPRYEEAWKGKFQPFMRVRKGGVDQETIDAVVEQARNDDAVVLTDSAVWTKTFHEAGHRSTFGLAQKHEKPPTVLAAGGWFDGEGFSGTHLLVRDIGLWPGGLGPSVVSGVTLVASKAEALAIPLDLVADGLKSMNYRGLVSVDLLLNQHPESGEVSLVATGAYTAGWEPFQSHAFISDQPSFGSVLEGYEPNFPKQFVHCVGVSVPPWPLVCNLQSTSTPIVGPGGEPLDPKVLGSTFFHDMKVEDSSPQVVGLDGLVGIVRGSGNQLELAKNMALAYAGQIQVPEKQFRTDSGAVASQVMMMLEQNGITV